ATIGQAAYEQVARQGVAAERIKLVQRAHLRYEGTDAALVVAYGSAHEMQARFEETYAQRYSFLMPDKRLVIEAVSAEAIGMSVEQAMGGEERTVTPIDEPRAQATVALYSSGRHHNTFVYQRGALQAG